MTVMAEVFGCLPRFNLIAPYLKTVEKNIFFFVPNFRQLPFYKYSLEKKDKIFMGE